jgi:hypothetical protein
LIKTKRFVFVADSNLFEDNINSIKNEAEIPPRTVNVSRKDVICAGKNSKYVKTKLHQN